MYRIDNAPSKSHRLSIKNPDPEKPLFELFVGQGNPRDLSKNCHYTKCLLELESKIGEGNYILQMQN